MPPRQSLWNINTENFSLYSDTYNWFVKWGPFDATCRQLIKPLVGPILTQFYVDSGMKKRKGMAILLKWLRATTKEHERNGQFACFQ